MGAVVNAFNVLPTSAFQHELSREALRDYFAGQAMIALGDTTSIDPAWVAKKAYEQADAMLEARAK